MPHLQFNFYSELDPEILIAFLSDGPFESFLMMEETTAAFIPESMGKKAQAYMEQINWPAPVKITTERIEPKNWNALWESNFKPVLVSSFCLVRAPFHERSSETNYDVVIKPEMAFGTGHHETTYLMIQQMEGLEIEGKKVLDFGCGTGVLALLSSLMGATCIDAIDNDIKAVDSTRNNAILNNIDNINILQAELHAVSENDYDIVLANINRHVILNSLSTLYQMLRNESKILLSGILKEDRNLIANSLGNIGFDILKEYGKGEWIAVLAKK